MAGNLDAAFSMYCRRGSTTRLTTYHQITIFNQFLRRKNSKVVPDFQELLQIVKDSLTMDSMRFTLVISLACASVIWPPESTSLSRLRSRLTPLEGLRSWLGGCVFSSNRQTCNSSVDRKVWWYSAYISVRVSTRGLSPTTWSSESFITVIVNTAKPDPTKIAAVVRNWDAYLFDSVEIETNEPD